MATIAAALADLDSVSTRQSVRDRLAYAVLALREVERSIERTADAWERRGYWLKVDQFRREWAWAGQGAADILGPLLDDDLPAAKTAARALLQRLGQLASTGSRKRHADPWIGAFARLKADRRAAHDAT
jgi:hypothetical protein